MKLREYLKQFEGMDPETEVDENGRSVVNMILIKYFKEGYEAKHIEDNPYPINSLAWKCFNKGFNKYLIEYFKNEFNLLPEQLSKKEL